MTLAMVVLPVRRSSQHHHRVWRAVGQEAREGREGVALVVGGGEIDVSQDIIDKFCLCHSALERKNIHIYIKRLTAREDMYRYFSTFAKVGLCWTKTKLTIKAEK